MNELWFPILAALAKCVCCVYVLECVFQLWIQNKN